MAAKIFMDLPGGLKMPAVGLGTGSVRQESELVETLNSALKLGYRHIDTANAYNNEVFIGNVLKKWFESGKLKREDIFITTKLPIPGVHQDRVETYMKKSLENLQLDYVDLYLIHFPIGTKITEQNDTAVDEVDHLKIWKKMEEQVDAGRTKTIGLSNFNQRQIDKFIKYARIKPACLQVELHVDFQQRDLVDFCHKNRIVVVGYAPLGTPVTRETVSQHKRTRKVPPAIENEIVTRLAEKYKKTAGQILLRYLLQRNIVVIPKSSNPNRQKENIDVFDFEISLEDMKSLDQLDAGKDGRIYTFNIKPAIEKHPEFPFEV